MRIGVEVASIYSTVAVEQANKAKRQGVAALASRIVSVHEDAFERGKPRGLVRGEMDTRLEGARVQDGRGRCRKWEKGLLLSGKTGAFSFLLAWWCPVGCRVDGHSTVFPA